jgi:hypothetical protein
MSALLLARERFTTMLARFLLAIEARDQRRVLDYVRRCDTCPLGHPRSTHRVGLGADIILYDASGRPLMDGAAHEPLHDLWDARGGAPRIAADMGHYSLPWEGVR